MWELRALIIIVGEPPTHIIKLSITINCYFSLLILK